MAITRLTEAAEEYRQNKPGFSFKILEEDGQNVIIKKIWYHKGVSSKSTAERDNMAADALFHYGREFVAEWNEDLDNAPVRFAGVEYTNTEGGWLTA